jgi:hypothetical protein
MSKRDHEALAIALFIPDQTLQTLQPNTLFRFLEVEGPVELDFLPPPWWESSHAVHLGLFPPQPWG